MLTPRFSLAQDAQFLTVTIYAPFTNIDQTEVFMEERDFRFSSPPYFLRLHLPGEVEESEAAKGAWDAETTSFVVQCPKAVEGEHFAGLEMLTQLLTPRGDTEVRTGVEELGGEGEEQEEEEEEEWYFEQQLPEGEEAPSLGGQGYGFGFRHSAAYSRLLAEFGELVDVPAVDGLTYRERDAAREAREAAEFSADHYLADLFSEDVAVEESLAWAAPAAAAAAFTREEQERLVALPRVRPLVARPDLAATHLALADLLYGQCFARRWHQGEASTEAGWLAAKLSPSLSSCTRLATPAALVRSCVRRALTYPYCRHWRLATAVWRDVVEVLEAGTLPTIQALLHLSTTFADTPGYYIFNQLYVTDYLSWLQALPPSHLASLAAPLTKALAALTKAQVGLELEELEEAARLTLLEEEEGEVEQLARQLGRVEVGRAKEEDSDDDTSSDSDDDTSEDEGKS